jgi:hypothetical protein
MKPWQAIFFGMLLVGSWSFCLSAGSCMRFAQAEFEALGTLARNRSRWKKTYSALVFHAPESPRHLRGSVSSGKVG